MSLPPTYVKGFHDEEAIRKMKYKPLGKTGLLVSEISLGTGPFGNVYGDITEEKVSEIVTTALKAGINYIDTAPYYGFGKAEILLGKVLKNIPRQAYYLATKACRYEQCDHTAQRTRESIDESLKRLQVDYVDIIQIHDVEFAPSEDMILNETLPVLLEAVQAGKFRYIGITGYHVSTLASIAQKSKVPIHTILSFCRCGLLDRALVQYEDQFRDLGVGVINASPVCLGLLTEQGPPVWHQATDEIKEACREAVKYCKSQGVSISRLAVRTASEEDLPSTVLVGANNKEIILENIKTSYTPLTEKENNVREYIKKTYFKPLKTTSWEASRFKMYYDGLKAGK